MEGAMDCSQQNTIAPCDAATGAKIERESLTFGELSEPVVRLVARAVGLIMLTT